MLQYSKFMNFVFPISSIIAILSYIFIIPFSTVDGEYISKDLCFQLYIIIFIFFILPYDFVRWKRWGGKQRYERKIQKLSTVVYDATELIKRSEKLSDTINTTFDSLVFDESISELKRTLKSLKKYEKYGIFKCSSPTDDLNELLEKEEKARSEFQRRTTQQIMNLSVSSDIGQNDYDNMDGHDFEYFCSDILRKNGFYNVEVTQGSGDHGIDILAEKDDISYAIQCKCYSSNIGNAAVQQAHTGKSLYKKDVAVVMTNQFFTQQAKDEAIQLGVKLWDRDKLNEFINRENK